MYASNTHAEDPTFSVTVFGDRAFKKVTEVKKKKKKKKVTEVR